MTDLILTEPFAGLCNTNRACSDGPISEALCHERGCCFLESAIHLHNCFQKVLKGKTSVRLRFLNILLKQSCKVLQCTYR